MEFNIGERRFDTVPTLCDNVEVNSTCTMHTYANEIETNSREIMQKSHSGRVILIFRNIFVTAVNKNLEDTSW